MFYTKANFIFFHNYSYIHYNRCNQRGNFNLINSLTKIPYYYRYKNSVIQFDIGRKPMKDFVTKDFFPDNNNDVIAILEIL